MSEAVSPEIGPDPSGSDIGAAQTSPEASVPGTDIVHAGGTGTDREGADYGTNAHHEWYDSYEDAADHVAAERGSGSRSRAAAPEGILFPGDEGFEPVADATRARESFKEWHGKFDTEEDPTATVATDPADKGEKDHKGKKAKKTNAGPKPGEQSENPYADRDRVNQALFEASVKGYRLGQEEGRADGAAMAARVTTEANARVEQAYKEARTARLAQTLAEAKLHETVADTNAKLAEMQRKSHEEQMRQNELEERLRKAEARIQDLEEENQRLTNTQTDGGQPSDDYDPQAPDVDPYGRADFTNVRTVGSLVDRPVTLSPRVPHVAGTGETVMGGSVVGRVPGQTSNGDLPGIEFRAPEAATTRMSRVARIAGGLVLGATGNATHSAGAGEALAAAKNTPWANEQLDSVFDRIGTSRAPEVTRQLLEHVSTLISVTGITPDKRKHLPAQQRAQVDNALNTLVRQYRIDFGPTIKRAKLIALQKSLQGRGGR